MTIKEIATRLETAFPELKVGTIESVIVGPNEYPPARRQGWRIVMGEPRKEDKNG